MHSRAAAQAERRKGLIVMHDTIRRSTGGSMVRSLRALLLSLSLLTFPSRALPQDSLSGQDALARALALADLYNWADAAPLFQQAKFSFEQAGDQRNALYARLGLLRANIER